MHIILYLDIFLFLNFAVDLYCLCLTGYLMKQRMRWFRLVGGAMFGAGMLLPFMMYPESLMGIKGIFWSAGISMGAVGIALGRKGGLIKKWTLATTILIILGGIMNSLQIRFQITSFSFGIWMLFISSCAGAGMLLCANVKEAVHKRNTLYSVQVKRGIRKTKGVVLLDTGNRLRDSLFGKPVIVMSDHFLNAIFTTEERRFIQTYQENGYIDYEGLLSLDTQRKMCFHEIAYQSVGNPSGRMLCFIAEEVAVSEGTRIFRKQPIGIGKDSLFADKSYDGLLFADGME